MSRVTMAPAFNADGLWCSARRQNANFEIHSPLSRKFPNAASSRRPFCSPKSQSLRYAVLGAGFAGLSVVWHLLEHVPKELNLCIDVYDEVGIGGGASGISGGLLHPYSPKAKLLWRGAECWKECLKMLNIAESALASSCKSDCLLQNLDHNPNEQIAWRRGILRPATSLKNVHILKENAENCLESCKIKSIDKYDAQNLVPHLCAPFDYAIYMPQAVNIHPQRYLQALFSACKRLVKDSASMGYGEKEINLHRKHINSLRELAGEYNAVIICIGAKGDLLPELYGKLPVRTCRGVVGHFTLPSDIEDAYADNSPSVLSDAWLAFQGPRDVVMGSTWNWRSRNYLASVSEEEASMAMEELLPKVSAVYPSIRRWKFAGARAGVRAMPPLTPLGSIPLVGNVDYAMNGKHRCKYWLLTGLGSRGLLYHGWLGKLMAQAVLSSHEDILPVELTSWKKLT